MKKIKGYTPDEYKKLKHATEDCADRLSDEMKADAKRAPNGAQNPLACLTFNPMRSELFGFTRHCRDCGKTEKEHDEAQHEAAEQAYQGKLLDAAENEEERIAISEFFAG